MSETSSTSTPHKVGLGSILAWLFGLMFVLTGIINIFIVPAAGIVMTIAGLILLPLTRHWAEHKLNIKVSKGVVVVLVIICIGIAGSLYSSSAANKRTENSPAATTNATPTSTNITTTATTINTPAPTPTPTETTPAEPQQTLASTSFDDFKILCDSNATSLQKQDVFDKKFKNQYVQWTGEITSISDSWGSYFLHVKHCPSTFTSDITITMKDDQKDALLSYKQGDTVTYKAKLTDIGDILGLSASDGEVVKK